MTNSLPAPAPRSADPEELLAAILGPNPTLPEPSRSAEERLAAAADTLDLPPAVTDLGGLSRAGGASRDLGGLSRAGGASRDVGGLIAEAGGSLDLGGLTAEADRIREQLAGTLAKALAPFERVAEEHRRVAEDLDRQLEPLRRRFGGRTPTATELAERFGGGVSLAEALEAATAEDLERSAEDLTEKLGTAAEEFEDLAEALDAVAEFDPAAARSEVDARLAGIRLARDLARQHLAALRRAHNLAHRHLASVRAESDRHHRRRRLERCRYRPALRADEHSGGPPPPDPCTSPLAANAPPSRDYRARIAATAA